MAAEVRVELPAPAAGPRPTARYRRWWPIARTGMLLVFRRRIFWLFFLLGLLNFLLFFSLVYFDAQLRDQLMRKGVRLPSGIHKLVFSDRLAFTGTGKGYRDFLISQNLVVMLLLGFAGSLLIGNDFRFRTVAFYLSKPISKWNYFLGKFGAVAALTALVTLLPALVLFLEYGLMSESLDYFYESRGILWAILIHSLLICTSSAAVVLGVSVLFVRTIPILAVWGTIFVFLPILGRFLRDVTGHWTLQLVDFWAILRWTVGPLYGRSADRLPLSIAVLTIWLIASLAIFHFRVRAVQVVR